MENTSSIRLELGIDAKRFMQQIQLDNKIIENQISEGIKLALDDISNEGNFVEVIRLNTKKELTDMVNKAIMSWDIRNKITKLVEEKISEKIDAYADRIANKITSSLK